MPREPLVEGPLIRYFISQLTRPSYFPIVCLVDRKTIESPILRISSAQNPSISDKTFLVQGFAIYF